MTDLGIQISNCNISNTIVAIGTPTPPPVDNWSPLNITGIQLWLPTASLYSTYVENSTVAAATQPTVDGDKIGQAYLPTGGHAFQAASDSGRSALASDATRNSSFAITATQLDLYNSTTALDFLYCSPSIFTILFWVKVNSDATTLVLFDSRNSTSANIGLTIARTTANKLSIGISKGSSIVAATTAASLTIASGWQRVIIKNNGTGSNSMSVQIGSGSVETFTTGSFNAAGTACTSNWRLGKTTTGNNTFDGNLSELVISNTIISASDITSYDAYNPTRNYTSLVTYTNNLFTDPSSINYLYGWFDCSDITTLFQDNAGATPVTTNGNPIGLVKCKGGLSTFGRNMSQSSGTAKPAYGTGIQNGLSAAVFTGQWYPGAPTVPNQNWGFTRLPLGPKTFFIVGKNSASSTGDNTPGGSHFIGYDANTLTYYVQVTASAIGHGETSNSTVCHLSPAGTNSYLAAAPNGGNSWNVYEFYNSPGANTIVVDGTTGATQTSSGANFAPNNIGKDFHGTGVDVFSWDLNGYFAEVVMFSTYLTSAQRQTIRLWLANKWNIPNVT